MTSNLRVRLHLREHSSVHILRLLCTCTLVGLTATAFPLPAHPAPSASTARVDPPRIGLGAPAPLPGSILAFTIHPSDIQLSRLAQPHTYLDKTGRRFALLGTEAGEFEAWAWPLKLFTGFRLSFYVNRSTTPIAARDIVQRIDVRPEATTITYLHQSFAIKMHVVASVDEPGALLLLDVDSDEPLTIVAGFIPTMQPMWPAGLGGQYARWDEDLRAYLISESSRRNHAYVGSPAGSGMSYTPAHMLGEAPNEFRIDVPDPSSVRGRFIPVVMAGGKGERNEVREAYTRLVADPESVYTKAHNHFASLLAGTTSITTPEPTLDLAFEWAKISYDNLLASNPDFDGTGLMAGLDRAGSGGRPGFGWFFGGDTYINTLSLNALGMFDASRAALSLMTQFQRDDGKMAHEVTQAWRYVDWFGDYPYAYIHADTSPWYIAAVHDHYAATGDRKFLQAEWPALLRAYAWCLTTDVDGDGLMDNEAAGLGALEFGSMTDIRTDIYLGAVWTRALQVMPELARAMGDPDLAMEATTRHGKALSAFEKFWSEGTSQYAYGFTARGTTVGETTPWPSVGMLFGYGTPERRLATMERLSRSDMTTDWGIRMLSTASDLFEPLNYNYGAVWPFVTSWTTTAHFLTGRPVQGYSSLMSTVQHVYTRSLGDIQEVMSGSRHTWPAESVPHQGFAIASTVLPTVRGLLGLFYDAPSNTLAFGPQVPDNWEHYSVKRFPYGAAQIHIGVVRSGGTDIYEFEPASPTTLRFRPLLPPGTRVESVRSGNRQIDFYSAIEPGGVRLDVSVDLDGPTSIEIVHSNEPMIIPPVWKSPLGAESTGLRVLSYERDGPVLDVVLEGRAGKEYRLGITEAVRVTSVEGAALTEGGLDITLPLADTEHTTLRVSIRFDQPDGGPR